MRGQRLFPMWTSRLREQNIIKNRRYNNAFLGFLGGKTAGTVGGTVEAFSDQDMVSRLNEHLDEIDKLERSGPDLDNELANVIRGDYSNVKEKSGEIQV